MARPAYISVNLIALQNNYALAQAMAQQNIPSKTLAVIKANAYGHGAVMCSKALSNIADGFAVSCIEEALELRSNNIQQPILLLEGFFEAIELHDIVSFNLDTVIHCEDQIRALELANLSKPITIWLKMDTGMNRLGINPKDYINAWMRLNKLDVVDNIILMTHLAYAHAASDEFSQLQMEIFSRFSFGLKGDISIANSSGIIQVPNSHSNWNRAGLIIYGVSPLQKIHAINSLLQPVMSFFSEIISIKNIDKGQSVGYSRTWKSERETLLGVVALGYADGYLSSHMNDGYVLILNQKASIVGRISMDMMTVDLTDIKGVKVGGKVTFWGEGLSIYEVAKFTQKSVYELLCNVNRVPIMYTNIENTCSEKNATCNIV